ncbi:GntR family transcriptional regulator, partial [Streptomyces sp. NPDC126497]|uniref:GntR family transcriptional regulator n=1 Tax=Streptomyces sp. NPDC126497 TaxID=3155313 RepID=UPI00331D1FB0
TGAPAAVAAGPGGAPAGPAAPPLPTAVGLAPRITAAFEAEHVAIDAVCLTAVSLTLAVGEPLRGIRSGRLEPAKVDVRVLLPGRDVDLAFPVPVEGREEDGALLRERWLAQRDAQGQVLRHNLLSLRATHGIDVRVSFRALPFTPPVKLYLLNGEEALLASCTPVRGGEQTDRGRLETYGVQGTRSMLFGFGRGPGPRDAAFVEQSGRWFDALWGTIGPEPVLTG